MCIMEMFMFMCIYGYVYLPPPPKKIMLVILRVKNVCYCNNIIINDDHRKVETKSVKVL